MKDNLKKNKLKNERRMIKGITLIALVITIVVLIILAAVSIAMLTGENGLITKAEQAKDQTDLAGIREELQIMWQELLIETNNGRGYTEKEIAEYFENKIKEKDANATVKYNEAKKIYEISYKNHLFEINAGNLTMNREEAINDVEDAWDNIDQTVSNEDKAEQIEDQLQEKDPNSSAEYNPDTGKIEIEHGGENIEIDEDGNVEIVGPSKDPNVDVDTDGDGDPDINIDTDGDGDPDINIDTDGDGDPDINIDTDGDKDPDINIDTDGDGDPDINIDTDGDGDPDVNVDTDGDGKPDINIDTDGDGEPDINIDTDGDGDPDVNVDTDGM